MEGGEATTSTAPNSSTARTQGGLFNLFKPKLPQVQIPNIETQLDPNSEAIFLNNLPYEHRFKYNCWKIPTKCTVLLIMIAFFFAYFFSLKFYIHYLFRFFSNKENFELICIHKSFFHDQEAAKKLCLVAIGQYAFGIFVLAQVGIGIVGVAMVGGFVIGIGQFIFAAIYSPVMMLGIAPFIHASLASLALYCRYSLFSTAPIRPL